MNAETEEMFLSTFYNYW